MIKKANIAVLISGRGSNLMALAQACQQEDFPAQIGLVISNKAQAPGLAYAHERSLPTLTLERKNFSDKQTFEEALHQALISYNVDLICAAGFMHILSKVFIDKWPQKILNIHPSLLPDFPGLETHARVLASGKKVTGCTVHYLTEEVDGGPIIDQISVPVLDEDTVETLAARVLEAEHKLYPRALKKVILKIGARITTL